MDVRESEEHPFLGREMARPRRFSEETAKSADMAVRRLIREAHERARDILEAHRPQVARLVALLEEKETLDRIAVAACLGPKEVRSGGVANLELRPASDSDEA
jgi:cell division protease FtsH